MKFVYHSNSQPACMTHKNRGNLNNRTPLGLFMLGEGGSDWMTRLQMMVAKKLLASEWSQAETAAILGTTQSTISRLVTRPMPTLPGSADESVIDGWGNELAQALIQLGPSTKVVRQRFVTEFQLSGNQIIRFDSTLTGTDLDKGQLRTALLRRLDWASNRIMADTISPYLPEVGMNIAACTENPKGVDDVCAFPGRLVFINGKLKPIESASFGSSNHLAGVLLQARKIDRDKGSILNLRPPKDNTSEGVDITAISNACAQLNWTFAEAPRGDIANEPEFCDLLLDSGGFGWEPTMYILANNPLELVDNTHKFISALKAVKS